VQNRHPVSNPEQEPTGESASPKSAILCGRIRTPFPLMGPRFHFMGSPSFTSWGPPVSPHGVLSFAQTNPSFISNVHPQFHIFCGFVSRFRRGKRVAIYLALIPQERSSGGRQRLGGHQQTSQAPRA